MTCTTVNDGRWLAGDHVPKKEYWKILRFNTMSKGWYRNAFFLGDFPQILPWDASP